MHYFSLLSPCGSACTFPLSSSLPPFRTRLPVTAVSSTRRGLLRGRSHCVLGPSLPRGSGDHQETNDGTGSCQMPANPWKKRGKAVCQEGLACCVGPGLRHGPSEEGWTPQPSGLSPSPSPRPVPGAQGRWGGGGASFRVNRHSCRLLRDVQSSPDWTGLPEKPMGGCGPRRAPPPGPPCGVLHGAPSEY